MQDDVVESAADKKIFAYSTNYSKLYAGYF